MTFLTTVTAASSIDRAEVADEAHGDEADGELEDGGEDVQGRDVLLGFGPCPWVLSESWRRRIYRPDAVGAGLGSNDALAGRTWAWASVRTCEAGRGIGIARGSSSCATFLAAVTWRTCSSSPDPTTPSSLSKCREMITILRTHICYEYCNVQCDGI
jgi:hypothetical protein